MSTSSLAQQPDGLEVDVDDLEIRVNTAVHYEPRQERRTSSQSFSEKSVHGDRR